MSLCRFAQLSSYRLITTTCILTLSAILIYSRILPNLIFGVVFALFCLVKDSVNLAMICMKEYNLLMSFCVSDDFCYNWYLLKCYPFHYKFYLPYLLSQLYL